MLYLEQHRNQHLNLKRRNSITSAPMSPSNLRPGSHNEVFCTIFWHQSFETSCKSMTHYCAHLSSITLNSLCENENQTLESLADFLRGNKTELYFPSKFSKSRRFQPKNWAFSHAFENIEPQSTKKCSRCQRRKKMLHDYQAKLLKEIFTSFVLIDNDEF